MSCLKAFGLAFNMLTIFPLFTIHSFDTGINGRSAIFYPLIGFLLGGVLYGLYALLSAHLPQTHLAVILFALSILFSGALHLDGLADTIDGLFVDKNRSLEVMKDPHIGGMGMVLSVVFLVVKLSAFIHFQAWELLAVVMLLSRFGAVVAIYNFRYISSGVGALIKEELQTRYLLTTLLYTSLLAFLFGFSSGILLTLLTTFLLGSLLSRRYGGLNGDMYGFIIEINELILLNYLIFQ
ncbi:MAG: adenosylcobinamide-GDP ribazoletransferase [Epsilonproteobacteria bacterium]|nr:adenosylcobinamide-GDP ribazoletransferase [Campylobacterota bacterium]